MFDFIGKKKIFFVFSAVIILSGIIGLIVNGGFEEDIQFKGGTEIEIQMKDGNFEADKAEQILAGIINRPLHAQKSYTLNADANNEIINLLVIKIADNNLSSKEHEDVMNALNKEYGIDDSYERTERNIDATISQEIKNKGIMAVVIAAILMLLYIWWRFNVMSGLFAGVTAVVALLHDAAIMLTVYALFQIPLNESFIAAMLTILGYSMNDTIIIYDRIRENSKLLRKETLSGLVNKSVAQTLSRSINTTATTLICVLTIYIFASYNRIESIQEFTLPLIIGLASGTYSSIFIASPLWVMWKESQAKRLATKPAKA